MHGFQIGHGLGGIAQVGLGDNFQQGGAGAVEVYAGLTVKVLMQGLASIFLQVRTSDPYRSCAPVFQLNLKSAAADNGRLELTDLVALGQIGIKVVLAVEDRAAADFCANSQAKHHRAAHGFGVEHWQHTGHREIDGAGLGVGLGAERGGRAREDLGPGGQLQVHFKPYNSFPLHHWASPVAMAGRRWCQSVACWKRWPTFNSCDSAKCRPISCSPTGAPAMKPAGTDIPGNPARLTARV